MLCLPATCILQFPGVTAKHADECAATAPQCNTTIKASCDYEASMLPCMLVCSS